MPFEKLKKYQNDFETSSTNSTFSTIIAKLAGSKQALAI